MAVTLRCLLDVRQRAAMLLLPYAVAALGLTVFFALAASGWPGEFTAAGGAFCEAFGDGLAKQPANTWSNLGFVAAGLWMAQRASNLPRAGDNPFTRSRTMPIVYAALVVFLGPGSMLMHGSGRAWGATADVVSMLVWIAFPAAYALARCFGAGERGFWALYLLLAVGLGLPRALDALPFSGTLAYVVLIPVIGVGEAVAGRRPDVTREWRPLLGATACFALAFVIWRLSHTDGPLCDPHSLLQGHAAWHLLCAASTVGIFLFYASEDERASPPGTDGSPRKENP